MNQMEATEHDKITENSAGEFAVSTRAKHLRASEDYFSQLGIELRVFQSADLIPIKLFSLRRDGCLLWLDSLSSHDSFAGLWAAWCRYLGRLHWHEGWLISMAELYSSGCGKKRRCATEWIEQLGRARSHQKDQWPWSSARYCPAHGKLVFAGCPQREVGGWNVSFDPQGELDGASRLLHFDPDYPKIYMDSARRLLAVSDSKEICRATVAVGAGTTQSRDAIALRRL